MEHSKKNWHLIGSLGFTLIASYGSLLYAFSLLAPEIHRTLGWRMELVFGAFSWGLLVAGLSSTPAGLLIDRFGGRFVMAAGSLICGAGLIGLSQVQALWQYYGAWTVLGVGMALVFYEAAFATINRAWTTGEMVFARRAAPEVVEKLTFAMLPAALAVLLFLGIEQWVVAAFCGLYGLSNGILTIVRGTVPQKLFGRENYGAIAGALAGPTLMAQAAGPLAIAALVEAEISSKAVFTTLLTISLASAAFYLAAVRRQPALKGNKTSSI